MNSTEISISEKALKVIGLVKRAINNSPTGVSFFSIKNYTNSSDEVSNNLLNVGINFETAKQKDIAFLRELDVTTLENVKSSKIDLEKAKVVLIEAFEKPNENRSNGQKDAYTIITSGVKVHNESGLLFIYGFRVSKQVLKEGVYKSVKSSALTIAKNELRKLLKTNKFKQFSIEIGNELTAKGETIEL